MNKSTRMILFALILIFIPVSTGIAFGNTAIPLEKSFKAWKKDKGKNGYIIGSFKMIHTIWDINDPRVNELEDINIDCDCFLFASLQKTDENKIYKLKFKPIPGSKFPRANPKQLNKNENDPYWILEVPAGEYALTTVTFKLLIRKSGYEEYNREMGTIPFYHNLNRDIRFNVKPKQIIYIGDYLAEFRTNIRLKTTDLYPINQIKINLTDNYEETKEILLHNTVFNLKDKFEIVSAL